MTAPVDSGSHVAVGRVASATERGEVETAVSRRFRVRTYWLNPDGSESALARDLRDESRKSRLDKLTDDFLIQAEPMPGWPRGARGAWIMGPLGDDVVIAQWEPGEMILWRVPGLQPGLLTVLRVIPRAAVPDFLEQGPP